MLKNFPLLSSRKVKLGWQSRPHTSKPHTYAHEWPRKSISTFVTPQHNMVGKWVIYYSHFLLPLFHYACCLESLIIFQKLCQDYGIKHRILNAISGGWVVCETTDIHRWSSATRNPGDAVSAFGFTLSRRPWQNLPSLRWQWLTMINTKKEWGRTCRTFLFPQKHEDMVRFTLLYPGQSPGMRVHLLTSFSR